MLRNWICLNQILIQLLMVVHFSETRTIQELMDRSELCKPESISVVLTSWQPICVTLHWGCAYHNKQTNELSFINFESLRKLSKEKDRIISQNELTSFRITYFSDPGFRFTQLVPSYINRTNIDNLQPNTKYTLTITSISANNQVGVSSRNVDFVSPALALSPSFNNNIYYNSISSLRLDIDDTINVRVGEVLVVIGVLCVWFFTLWFGFKKWGKIRSLEPQGRSRIRTGKSIVETDSLNGTAPTKSRLQSFANIAPTPKIHMSESNDSIYSDHQSLLGTNCKHNLLSVSPRPRLNSFIIAPSRRASCMPEENRLPRRYKSAEDLQSLVLEITEAQRQQRKLSQISIKETDQTHLEGCNLINNLGSKSALINHSKDYLNQQYSGSNTSRGSNGTLKLDIATMVGMVANNANQINQHKSRTMASPSKSSSSERGALCSTTCTSGTCTSSSGTSTQQSSLQQTTKQRYKNSIGIQISSDSNHSTQATIASCERDLDSASAINCTYCRRRMSNCDECTHCNSLNMSTMTNRNLVLMQSRSFINHTCSSENSSFENPLTSSITNLNVSSSNSGNSGNGANQILRTSQQCLFQISEANDDIKHIDED